MNSDIRKSLVFRAAIGFPVGMLSGVGIFALFVVAQGEQNILQGSAPELMDTFGGPIGAFLVQAVVLGFYGSLTIGGTVLYDIESWGIVRSTASHFLITMAGYVVIALLFRWMSLKDAEFWIVIFCQAAGYFLIWLIISMISRKNVKIMNEQLGRWKEKVQ